MSNKNFLQELESIKQKIVYVQNLYMKNHDEIYPEVVNGLGDAVSIVQTMINQCIEIQLHMMKAENAKNRYKPSDL